MARIGEDDLIERYLAPLAGPGGLGFRDDAALLAPPPGRELVVTVDAVVAGVHFLPGDPPASIARKALGVNLSDLAAKGADPLGHWMTLALPDDWTEDWLAAFCGGLGRTATEARCPLLGGDTVRSAGPLSISITAMGSVPAGTMVRRTAARPDDLVAVTGTIGDAALGLLLAAGKRPPWAWALGPDEIDFLIERYREPRPRLVFAEALRRHAHAAMDVSDGLTGDLNKLLWASARSGSIDIDRVPLSAPARMALSVAPDLLPRILGGGDDYEILFTAAPDAMKALEAEARRLRLPVAVMGVVGRDGEGLTLWQGGRPSDLAPDSFGHFGGG